MNPVIETRSPWKQALWRRATFRPIPRRRHAHHPRAGCPLALALALLVGCSDGHREPVGTAQAPILVATGWGSAGGTVFGLSSGEELGASLAWLGDTDGDGLDEVAAGAPTGAGRVALLRWTGSALVPTSRQLVGSGSEGLGTSVLGVGDVDADGYADLVVGAPLANLGAGRVALHLGGPAGIDPAPAAEWTGAAPGELFGWALAAGDIDGDGRTDLVVGAPQASGAGALEGRVDVLAGTGAGFEPTTLTSWTVPGSSLLGASVAVGQADGVGALDVAAGAPGLGEPGDVAVFALGAAVPIWSTSGTNPSSELGSALAFVDLDGDGIDALVASHPGDEAVTGWSLVTGAVALEASGTGEAALVSVDPDGDGAETLLAGWAQLDRVEALAELPWAPGETLSLTVTEGPGASLTGAALASSPDGASLVVGSPDAAGLAGTVGAASAVELDATPPTPVVTVPQGVDDLHGGVDLDGDGLEDFFAQYDDGTGHLLSPAMFPLQDTTFNSQCRGRASLGEANGLPGADAVFYGSNYYLRLHDESGPGSPTRYLSMVVQLEHRPALGDVDGDGEPDVFVGYPNESRISRAEVLSGTSGTYVNGISVGLFQSHVVGALQLADLDGDGRDELGAISATGSPSMTVVWGDAPWSAGNRTTIGSPSGADWAPRDLVPMDSDADGREDFVGLTVVGEVVLVRRPASGGWGVRQAGVLPTGTGTGAELWGGDVDGDGFDDLLVRTDGAIHLARGGVNGLGDAPLFTLSHPGVGAIAAADLDGDGLQEVAVATSEGYDILPSSSFVALYSSRSDSASLPEGGAVSSVVGGGGLLDNDVLPPGATASLARPPAHGVATVEPDGGFLYEHDGSETTRDDFVYQVDAPGAAPLWALVKVEVAPVDSPPTAPPTLAITRYEGVAAPVSLPGVVDPEGEPLQIEYDCGQGFVTAPEPCVWPDDSEVQVPFTASDPAGLSVSGAVTVTVENVRPAIEPLAPGRRLLEGRPWLAQATFVDPGADTWTWSVDGPPGLLVHASLGMLSWTPTGDDDGAHVVSLRLEDDDGGVAARSFTLLVDRDGDGDGLGDRWEAENGLDPTRDEGSEDPDGDGLSNAQEYELGQDPHTFDGPGAPVLSSPVSAIPIQVGPVLVWSPALDPQDDPLTYRVQVFPLDAPESPWWDVSGIAGTQVEPALELGEDTLWGWRVSAADPWVQGPWSSTATFEWDAEADLPRKPLLLWPRAEVPVTRSTSFYAVPGEQPGVSPRVDLLRLEVVNEHGIALDQVVASTRGAHEVVELTLADEFHAATSRWRIRGEVQDGLNGPWKGRDLVHSARSPLPAPVLELDEEDRLDRVNPTLHVSARRSGEVHVVLAQLGFDDDIVLEGSRQVSDGEVVEIQLDGTLDPAVPVYIVCWLEELDGSVRPSIPTLLTVEVVPDGVGASCATAGESGGSALGFLLVGYLLGGWRRRRARPGEELPAFAAGSRRSSTSFAQPESAGCGLQ